LEVLRFLYLRIEVGGSEGRGFKDGKGRKDLLKLDPFIGLRV
jgi:hypothetical protein